jgi:hypothetical protein
MSIWEGLLLHRRRSLQVSTEIRSITVVALNLSELRIKHPELSSHVLNELLILRSIL